eukprot:scaffold647895_cov39-Prasinocladus_malaysianus.AAC.1
MNETEALLEAEAHNDAAAMDEDHDGAKDEGEAQPEVEANVDSLPEAANDVESPPGGEVHKEEEAMDEDGNRAGDEGEDDGGADRNRAGEEDEDEDEGGALASSGAPAETADGNPGKTEAKPELSNQPEPEANNDAQASNSAEAQRKAADEGAERAAPEAEDAQPSDQAQADMTLASDRPGVQPESVEEASTPSGVVVNVEGT